MSVSIGSKLPKHIRVTDLTARDGFQNIKSIIPTETKLKVLDAIVASGVRSFEVTSFVNPKAIPQMFDAGDVADYMLARYPDTKIIALVPNHRGAVLAAEHAIRDISYVMSASEGHNKANINRSKEESLVDLGEIARSFPQFRINLSLSTVFGCPFDGAVSLSTINQVIRQAVSHGIASVSLCDTIGVANPLQVNRIITSIREGFPELDIGVHFHDTHGMALANTFAALQLGVDRIEATAGGLGGCPFAPGAAGNVAMEDCLNMFWRMGLETGVAFEDYMRVVHLIRSSVSDTLQSHMASAKSYRDLSFG